ncbi:MAG: hypothetical protein AAB704_00755 [Patescibacteria group bacterium]
MKTKIFYLTLFSFALLALLYSFALVSGLFFYWRWFDIPMHFLGGFFAGGVSMWFFFKKLQSRREMFLATLFGALIIGAAWEFFEYFTGLAFVTYGNYVFDTIKDFLMDGFGALAFYALAVTKREVGV